MKEVSFLFVLVKNKQKPPNPKIDFAMEGTYAIFKVSLHLYEKEDQVL